MSIFGISRASVEKRRHKETHEKLKHAKTLREHKRKIEVERHRTELAEERLRGKKARQELYYPMFGGYSVSPKKVLHKGKQLAGSKRRIGIF